MEHFEHSKMPEEITRILENFAGQEEMSIGELYEYIIGFAKVCETDLDAEPFFEEMAEETGLSRDQIIGAAKAYAVAEEAEEPEQNL